MRRDRRERGSVLILVVLALGLFLLGVIGFGIDGSRLYAERQMAQVAADAAAQAAITSIFNHTNTLNPLTTGFSTDVPLTCSDKPSATPCQYASRNSFGTTRDTVVVTFFFINPPDSRPDLGLLSTDSPNLVHATVSRVVDTTLMRLLGSTATTVTAFGEAAILQSQSPTPILVLHPSMANALQLGGNTSIQICGGPSRSIQVNSWDPAAYGYAKPGSVDLHEAGPADNPLAPCTTGTGADFGVFGGPGTDALANDSVNVGSTGSYNSPSGVIEDPYKDVDPPLQPGDPLATQGPLAPGVGWCPATSPKNCFMYFPGYYSAGLDIKNFTAVFAPGVYYMGNGKGFAAGANGDVYMCTTCAPVADTGPGMLVYNSGGGTFNVGANGNVHMVGSLPTGIYEGILFFQDRSSPAATGSKSHNLGGGGCIDITGTIYLTNPVAMMLPVSGDPTHYQELQYHGNPCSGTYIRGDIVVGSLQLVGTADLAMRLDPTHLNYIRQVALVK